MNGFQKEVEAFKQVVVGNCQRQDFAYREWFVNDHLLIVERIAMELCDKYPHADRSVVLALVWFHDFGKPIDEDNEREITKTAGVEAMRSVGFPADFIDRVLASWTRMEMKDEIDISKEDIEVQIVSTADGASHFVGKFYPTYFMDNPEEGMAETVDRLKEKMAKDWNRKIVLPEVREAFKARYQAAQEIIGQYPDEFLPDLQP